MTSSSAATSASSPASPSESGLRETKLPKGKQMIADASAVIVSTSPGAVVREEVRSIIGAQKRRVCPNAVALELLLL